MQFELWQIIVLAIIQGVTEFLPISSDGHLVVAATWLAQGNAKDLDIPDLVIVLHGGTLLSIVVFYWRRLWDLLGNDFQTSLRIVVATIPAVVIGYPAKTFAEEWLGSTALAGIFLVVTGLVLVSARWIRPGSRSYQEMTFREALWIGIAQAAAILPGLSRSGCTITTGLHMRFSPRDAATFSFLMAVPVVGGACVLEMTEIIRAGKFAMPIEQMVVGVVVSFVAGLGALWLLVRWLERGRFAIFAWWCIPLGIAVLIWRFFLVAG